MADISSFKANMAQGGARSNQFRCVITFPTSIVSGANLAGNKAEFMCHAASIPASDVAPVEVSYRGRMIHFAGERTFQPWQVSVYNDNDFVLRSAFEGWVEGISHAEDTGGVLLPAAYQVDMEVHQMDRNDSILQKYKFIDAFPINVGEIGLSWADNNQIQTYNCTFQYNYFIKV
jgi:hypothetical protein